MTASGLGAHRIFVRASLHCVPSKRLDGSSCARVSTPPRENRACRGPELRRKEVSRLPDVYG